ncbi:MAG TPA: hypothetical protein VFY23_13770, partial [Candidatus Limnocylindrales bacterium]|nr:hypothetical protein [Candidatus Limnocylindrales bacterium]
SWTYFLVIEGGGWVGVGEERTRVVAGEAVVWPPDVLHAAWTDGVPMRAIVVEFATPPEQLGAGVLEGVIREIGPGTATSTPARGEGRLAPKPVDRASRAADPEAAEGEPI